MGLQVGEKQHLRKQISFYSAVREWKTSLATPSSLVLSLTLETVSQLTGRLFITKEEAGIV